MNRKHVFFYTLLRPLVVLFLRIKFGYRYEPAKDLPDNYIVLSNHTTDFDPLFVAASFRKMMYFVGSEHIARWKFAYKLLKFAFAPIMRYKGTVGASTVVEILRKIKAGANVCIFAEGDRCWDGRTSPVLPSTGKLVKSAKCGLVTYRITGGYFVSPRWSEGGTRRGEIYGSTVNVYTKDELAQMSVDEINAIIARDLYEDAYERQLENPKRYRSKIPAERLESLLFICPACGELDTMHSEKDTVTCDACGHSFRYDEYGMLDGTRCKTVRELYDWQKEAVSAMESPAFASPNGKVLTINNHVEELLAEGPVSMTPGKLCCGDWEIPVSEISDVAMHGRRALVFSAAKAYYELIPDTTSNAIKYLLLYDALKSKENTVSV